MRKPALVLAMAIVAVSVLAWSPPAHAKTPAKCPTAPARLNGRHVTKAPADESAFRCADLRGATLDGLDLTGFKFDGATLQSASFVGAKLEDADFTGANLNWADLTNATLFQARMTNVSAEDADFTRANLAKANLRGAYLTESDFTGAKLADADLTSANFSGASLDNADFTGAITDGAIFDGGDINAPYVAGPTGAADEPEPDAGGITAAPSSHGSSVPVDAILRVIVPLLVVLAFFANMRLRNRRLGQRRSPARRAPGRAKLSTRSAPVVVSTDSAWKPLTPTTYGDNGDASNVIRERGSKGFGKR
jgi:Pentapeptide repeats (8 copies)/Pentapeptide repeats (9 copies)